MRSVRGNLYLLSAVLVVSAITSIYQAPSAYAAQIQNRSLTLVAGTVGGSTPGNVARPADTVNHLFKFNLPTAATVGSLKFEYCTTPEDVGAATCVAPTGMDAGTNLGVKNATFGNETGSAVTGFSMGTKTTNSFILTRVANGVTANSLVQVQANNIVNPTVKNYTFFVRITAYSGTNGATGPGDTGSVAASTADPVVLSGVMPETLMFCTGATITVVGSTPDCSTATSAADIRFNQLFSPSDTATATSQMAASTNANGGYSITVNGSTLTSGSNTIPPLANTLGSAGATPQRGRSGFGMNLALNTTAISTVAVGANINPTTASDPTNLRGQAKTGYNVADQFKFFSGEVVAASDNPTPGPTNGQLYTVSYIVNVAGNQVSGNYSTTLTYICTPTF